MKKSLKDNFMRAMEWRSVGVSTFPIAFKTKRPLVRWSQYRDKLPKPAELKRFFTTYEVNFGVICGGETGLTVVDFDLSEGYEKFITEIPCGIAQMFEKTYKVKTAKGVHAYFWSKGMRSLKDMERKIDVKAEGGYVVAPFSTHPSGKKYTDMDCFDISKIKTLPPRVIENLFPEQKEKPKVDWDSIDEFYSRTNGTPFPSPNADLDEIRHKVPILKLAMQYTQMFPEKRGGHIYKGKCPLPTHDDKDPSFWVDIRTGLCGCFGNCELNKKATDVIGLYAKINGISYGEAVQEMRDW